MRIYQNRQIKHPVLRVGTPLPPPPLKAGMVDTRVLKYLDLSTCGLVDPEGAALVTAIACKSEYLSSRPQRAAIGKCSYLCFEI